MLNISKIVKTETCWLWHGAKTQNGYGQAQHNGRVRLAHRIAFELEYGPIPDGLQIDHICEVKNCVNPEHLRLATNQENQLANKNGLTGGNAAKTHCMHGHAFTKSNTMSKPSRPGQRFCRECKRISDRRRRHEAWLTQEPKEE